MQWFIVLFGSFLGSAIQTVSGFGCGVVLMVLLPFFFGLTESTLLCSAICLGLTIVLTCQFWKQIQWNVALLPTIAYVIFSTVAVLFVKKIDLRILTIIFAVFLILLAIYSFCTFRKKEFRIKATPALGFGFGALSGICGGFFGVGGPMIALYLLAASDKKENYLANITLAFVASNFTTTVTRVASGFYVEHFVPLALLGIAGSFVGKWVGLKITNRLNIETLKKVVYTFVGLSGIVTLIQQLT